MRDYLLRRYHARMAAAKAFLGGKCVKCDATENLHLDHIDPKTKHKPLSKMWTNEVRFWEEVRKCQLLCEDHHIEKTYLDMGWKKAKGVHGAPGSHKYCKCSECSKAWAAYQRQRSVHTFGPVPEPASTR